MYEIKPGAFLSSEFLTKYEGIQPRNKGKLFEVIYLRTYSRWVEVWKRRETWSETLQRVVEHSLSLYPKDGPASKIELIKEAELMFDKIFHLEVLPAGRSLWVAGTDASKKWGSALFNCSYLDIDSLSSFCEMFQLLLNGCGVGFGIQQESIEQIPYLCKRITLVNDSKKIKELMRYQSPPSKDETVFPYLPGISCISIGDSREGWVSALRGFFSIVLWREGDVEVHIDYSRIRPSGSRIKSFGGRAPGPDGLKEMFFNITRIIQNTSAGKLKPIDCMDIANFIAKNVIVGGTRRSSQIALGDPDDIEFLEAKKGLWLQKTNLQRTMSNNSVSFKRKPSNEKIREIFELIKNNGEPGFYNLEAVQKKAPNRKGGNPCNEIALDSRQFCNLCTVVLPSHIENGTLNLEKLRESMEVATRIGLRHTNVTVELPEWDYKQKRDRLLGVSLTGIMDCFNTLNWDFESNSSQTLLRNLKKFAKKEAKKYASEMRVPKPLLVTCIKPEGTLSQLPTVSSGIHSAYAPFYIRRIRISSMDPVAKALIKKGVPYKVDPGKAERLVFEFPIGTRAKSSANEEKAVLQFKRYLLAMENYVDHNCSITITIGESEYEEIIQMVDENWDKMVGCAWLPKNTKAYPLMPYEEIDVTEYFERTLKEVDLSDLPKLVNQIENEEYEEEPESECQGAACPVR